MRPIFSISVPLHFTTALWITLSLMVAFAVPAHAEIFKCVAKDRLDLYQNFPCQFDSIGWAPTNTAAPRSAAPLPSKQPNINPRAYADTVPGRSAASQSTLRQGMTTEEVRAMWGEPTDSHWEEPGEGERFEVWSYGNARSVRFIHGLVSTIQQ